MQQFGQGALEAEPHRRRKAPQHRQGRRVAVGLQPLQLERLFGLVNHQQARGLAPGRIQLASGGLGGGFAGEVDRQGLARLAHQAQHQGDHQRLLIDLARGGRSVLAHR